MQKQRESAEPKLKKAEFGYDDFLDIDEQIKEYGTVCRSLLAMIPGDERCRELKNVSLMTMNLR